MLSIASLLDRVQDAIARAFPRGHMVWVRGEIQSISDRTGHCYIDLVDPDGPRGRDTKVLKVKCWQRAWAPMKATLAGQGISLDVGTVVALRGRVEFYAPRAEVNLIAVDIDVDALLGRLAARRAALVKALESEGLLRRNASRPVPVPALRVGLVASPGTEGYNDFLGQLQGSALAFTVVVSPSQVQGPAAPASLARGIAAAREAACDLVVIVRGGGSKADLSAFDAEPVARAIATCPVPVFTGVGHTGDQSVADIVAARSFVTPTECGQEIVRRAEQWWASVTDVTDLVLRRATDVVDAADARHAAVRLRLGHATRHQVHRHGERLEGRARRIVFQVDRQLEEAVLAVDRRVGRIGPSVQRALEHQVDRLRSWRRLLAAYDVNRQLERGYTLTMDDGGRILRSARSVVDGSILLTRFADGTTVSVVQEVGSADQRPLVDDTAPRAERSGHDDT